MVFPKLMNRTFLFVLNANSISGFWTPDWSISMFLAPQVDPSCQVFVQEQEDTTPGT